MTASISFDQVQSFVANATRHAAGSGRMLVTDAGLELLLSLIIVVVIIVLLLSQGDPGVGMAP
ncbi:MAG: hypothetical protein PVG71_08960 [Anaerolineae bacterium]|jgi:hypothetical protein